MTDTTKFATLALLATATAAMAIALPATAYAGGSGGPTVHSFQSPSGNIACDYWGDENYTGGVQCEIREHSWTAPRASICTGVDARKLEGGDANGDEFSLDTDDSGRRPGEPTLTCYWGSGPLRDPIVPDRSYTPRPAATLDYGQTVSAGAITCGSELEGVTCTDSITTHYFRISRDSYELGG